MFHNYSLLIIFCYFNKYIVQQCVCLHCVAYSEEKVHYSECERIEYDHIMNVPFSEDSEDDLFPEFDSSE